MTHKEMLTQGIDAICNQFSDISPLEDGLDIQMTIILTHDNVELKRAINAKIGLIVLDKYLIFQTIE